MRKQEDTHPYATKAWLLDGKIHSIPGILSWNGSELIFTAYGGGTFFKKRLEALLENFGQPKEASAAIFADEPTTVFEAKEAHITGYKFPWYYFKQGVKIDLLGQKVRLSFIQPQNTKLPPKLVGVVISEAIAHASVAHISAEKADGKRWEYILGSLTR